MFKHLTSAIMAFLTPVLITVHILTPSPSPTFLPSPSPTPIIENTCTRKDGTTFLSTANCDDFKASPSLIPKKSPSLKTATTADTDPPVLCKMSAECGGGTTTLKTSECANSVCCGFGNRWVFYKDKSKCVEDQKKDSDNWKAAADLMNQATQQSIDNQNRLMEIYKQQMENTVNNATSQMNGISNQPVNVPPINGTITDPNPKPTPIVPVGYGYSP